MHAVVCVVWLPPRRLSQSSFQTQQRSTERPTSPGVWVNKCDDDENADVDDDDGDDEAKHR